MSTAINKYLRTIYLLVLEEKNVRQINLALMLGYARSSISIMVKRLKDEGLIIIRNNNIFLTFQGEELAKESLLAYQQTYSWLEAHGVLPGKAMEYADKIVDNLDLKLIELLIKS